jgi:hypothetical protein
MRLMLARSHFLYSIARNRDRSIGGTLTKLELYNELGNAARGVPSPHVWSGPTIRKICLPRRPRLRRCRQSALHVRASCLRSWRSIHGPFRRENTGDRRFFGPAPIIAKESNGEFAVRY